MSLSHANVVCRNRADVVQLIRDLMSVLPVIHA